MHPCQPANANRLLKAANNKWDGDIHFSDNCIFTERPQELSVMGQKCLTASEVEEPTN